MRRNQLTTHVTAYRKHVQGQVVQNFVTLALSLSPQFVNYILTSKANTLLYFVEKKSETFFSTKNNIVFVIFMFEILTNR